MLGQLRPAVLDERQVGVQGAFSPFGVRSCVPFSVPRAEIGVFDSASGVCSGPFQRDGSYAYARDPYGRSKGSLQAIAVRSDGTRRLS